ncbi:hypothetical protein K435DRAFT_850745 [Dendrothele bispora CBS 962.96]|uniref:Uncharacterized protein n=1 Tax=Dendrothele bispora (strain CBS 962.96) TaxID=1314807 RepID=A0A4S8MNW7_DENBC|nr:hypothetical protein K435DRAFT_850745 [Dendrothele bispora CBS 962.96]
MNPQNQSTPMLSGSPMHSGVIVRTIGTESAPHAGLGQGQGVMGVRGPRVVPPMSPLSESFPSVPTTALADPLMVYPVLLLVIAVVAVKQGESVGMDFGGAEQRVWGFCLGK